MIRVERRTEANARGLGEIVLDRPEKRNALTPQMLEGIRKGAEQLDADSRVRGIVVRGEGAVFCSGFDLTLCKEDSSALAEMLRGLSMATRALRRTNKPVVMAVHGAAIAGGCALLGGADLVIADLAAKLGYPVVRLGISPAVNTPLLRLAVGTRATRALSLDPALIDAREAQRIGLVDRVVDLPEDVTPRAQLEAIKLGEKPPGAFAATKRWLNEIDGSANDEELDRALAASLALVGSAEERERLAAMWAKGS